LLTYNELAQQDGLNQRRSTQEQVMSAREFAQELDGLSKLTGKQRKELADEMKARRREGDVQAFLMGQSAETQEAFMMATQKIKETMGPQFEALFQDLMIRGAPITEETRNAFIALGGSADEFEATVASFKSGMQTGEFDNFNSTLTNAQGAFLDNLKTDEARTMAMQSGLSGVADAMAAAYESSYDFANAVDASKVANSDSAATIARLQTQISEEQARQTQALGGVIDKTVQMQEALREFTVAATTEVLPRLESAAIKGIDMFLDRLPPAEVIAQQLADGVGKLFDTSADTLYNANPGTLITAGDELIAEAAAKAAEDQGFAVAEAETNILNNMSETEERAQAELQRVNTELRDQQKELADLTTEQSHAITNGQFERAAELQAQIDAMEANIQKSVQASAQAFTEARVAEYTRTGIGIRGFAEGGNIRAGEVGMVGEAGAEFIAGPAQVMSARTSMGVMDNLMKTIKALDTNVQTQNEQAQSGISNNSKEYTNLEPKFDAMIGLLSQLVSVEVGAERTAQRTFKATRGLQGNMLRGIGA
jgi:hypothetical protein